jgi:hypothetical protein
MTLISLRGKPDTFHARLILLQLVLCVATLVNGCVSNRAYRRGGEALSKKELKNQLPTEIEPDPDATTCGTPSKTCIPAGSAGLQPQHFYLSYIEFDDMGELWSIGDLNANDAKPSAAKQSQLETAIITIRTAKEKAASLGTELVVVAFIHGWHNNASGYDERNKNLLGFEQILQRLSFRKSGKDRNGPPPVVLGIFISWRGQVVPGDFFTSYWNRRDAARLVGGLSMTEVISRLMFETKGAPLLPNPNDRCKLEPIDGDDPQQAMDQKSRFIIIGHSFGARVLEHAISQPMLTMLLERQSQAESCVVAWNRRSTEAEQLKTINFQPPADLVVFLNPANDSFETKASIEAFKRSNLCRPLGSATHGDHPACSPLSFPAPLMISITSDGDWATGKVMPLAQTLSIPWKTFRKYDEDACELGELGSRGQTYYFRHNDGNVPEMKTHEVVDDVDPQLHPACLNDEWPYFHALVSGQRRCFQIITLAESEATPAQATCRKPKVPVPAPIPWNNTPYYVMRVPSTLIKDHNDIFQDGTVELLNALVSRFEIIESPPTVTAPAPSASRPLSKAPH